MAKESTIHRQMIQAVVKGREDGIVSSESKERSRRKVKRRGNCTKVKHDMVKLVVGLDLKMSKVKNLMAKTVVCLFMGKSMSRGPSRN